AKLPGVDPGSVDRPAPEVQSGSGGYHPHDYPTGDGGAPSYAFRDKAQLLGGCPERIAKCGERRTGLIAALTQATLTAELCAAADDNAPITPLQVVTDPTD